jgi:hypothetical protein
MIRPLKFVSFVWKIAAEAADKFRTKSFAVMKMRIQWRNHQNQAAAEISTSS